VVFRIQTQNALASSFCWICVEMGKVNILLGNGAKAQVHSKIWH
jgi:hypothetical protein